MTDVIDDEERYDPSAEHAFPDHRLNEVFAFVSDDPEIQAYLQAQNVNPVTRMGYNDHGEVHVRIVRDRALCLYELLKEADIGFNGAGNHPELEPADEPVIIMLAATLHDVGHVVHRDEHVYYSIPLAADVLDRILPEFYDRPAAVRMKGEILHAILCHHTPEDPLTTEASVIRVADALDMERGRSRMPYKKGGRGIDTISSQAIREVSVVDGDGTPVMVEIEMTNAAGVYQVDNLLKDKLRNSGLEAHIRIVAVNRKETREEGGQLVERIEL